LMCGLFWMFLARFTNLSVLRLQAPRTRAPSKRPSGVDPRSESSEAPAVT
jgi:hypothetical protein